MIKNLAGTAAQIAERYGLNTGTLANLRSAGQGPRYYRIGKGKGRIIYYYSDVETWIRETNRKANNR